MSQSKETREAYEMFIKTVLTPAIVKTLREATDFEIGINNPEQYILSKLGESFTNNREFMNIMDTKHSIPLVNLMRDMFSMVSWSDVRKNLRQGELLDKMDARAYEDRIVQILVKHNADALYDPDTSVLDTVVTMKEYIAFVLSTEDPLDCNGLSVKIQKLDWARISHKVRNFDEMSMSEVLLGVAE